MLLSVYYQIEYLLETNQIAQAGEMIKEHSVLFEELNFPLGKAMYYQVSGKLQAVIEYDASINWHNKAIQITDAHDLKSIAVVSFKEISAV